MNIIKIIKTFCISSLFTGAFAAIEPVVENQITQTQAASELSVPQQDEQSQAQKAVENMILSEPELTLPEERVKPPMPEPQIQEPEPAAQVAQPQAPVPAEAPITRVIAPGQEVAELTPKIKK